MNVLFRIKRFLHEADSTIGMWTIRDNYHCWVLEDEERTVKVKGETAIPIGVYEIVLEVSPKFGLVPTILNVRGFTSIRVHGGNTDDDTEGCPLVGYLLHNPNRISDCKPALDKIIAELKAAGGKAFISIEQYIGVIPIQ